MEEKIELRSEEMNEILGQIPSKIIRYGILVISTIVVIFLIGSNFFKYPEIIKAELTISCQNPPTIIYSEYSGKIDSFYIKNNQKIGENDTIATIKTSENKYIIKSSETGILSYSNFWSKNQFINKNEQLFSIISEKEGKYFGILKLPIVNIQKVKEGQKVNIKFISYPYMEYGICEGIISTISLTPTSEFYYVKVELPNNLKTNYKTDIPFRTNIQTTAEIITEDISVLQRIIKPIKSIF